MIESYWGGHILPLPQPLPPVPTALGKQTNTTQQIFVLMKSFFFIFRRRLQDVLIKNNIFVLAIRLQDVLKSSYQDVFKTLSRHLQDILQKPPQDIFKTSCKDVFKMFSRRIIKLNCLPRSRICLGHTSEKFMVSVENLQLW